MFNHLLFIAEYPDLLTFEWRVLYTCIATIIINIPFGYWTGALRKFSFWWFIAIHGPVPLVIIIRKFHNLQLSWTLAPFLLGSYFAGQYLGRTIYKILQSAKNKP